MSTKNKKYMRSKNIKLSSYRQWRKTCVSTWPSSHLSLLNQYINSMIVCLSIIAILCSVIVALSVVNYRLRSQVSLSKEILHFQNYVSAVSDTSWSETKLSDTTSTQNFTH